MKKYKAIFFDWDGTAVSSRKADANEVLEQMGKLLAKGVKLIIISGTTYKNICGGEIHNKLTVAQLENLYLGLGRGAYNYGFEKGVPVVLHSITPTKKQLLAIHQVCFSIHCRLLQQYDINTDIVFSRPNYCKIDLMPFAERGDKLYLQTCEIAQVQSILQGHGFQGGLAGLIELAEQIGLEYGEHIQATTDAKYLEVGISTKSNNVDFFMKNIIVPLNINTCNCAFWGDEFTYLADGIKGSDAFMMTTQTMGGDFFDVSQNPVYLPKGVTAIGGGIHSFSCFLKNQL